MMMLIDNPYSLSGIWALRMAMRVKWDIMLESWFVLSFSFLKLTVGSFVWQSAILVLLHPSLHGVALESAIGPYWP